MVSPPPDRRDGVLDFIGQQGGDGATIDEIAVALGLEERAATFAVADLLAKGAIHGAGLQRLDRINRFRTVFFATEG